VRRREFIAGLAGAALPVVARAQHSAMPTVGFLSAASPGPFADRVAAFRQGLREGGYIEGSSVAVEYRWAEGHYERLPALASDLVARKVGVIATGGGTISALAAKAATTTIPIVFSIGDDPIAAGLVESLNKPGGNLTGMASLTGEMGPKRLELLHEAVPSATTIAVLINPANPVAENQTTDIQAAARRVGVEVHILYASTERELDAAFSQMHVLRVGALVLGNDTFFNSRIEQLAALAVRHAVPAAYQYREFLAAGGLMTYGANNTTPYVLVGGYVSRILKGEKPADLPVQQATRIGLMINLKSAKSLGLTMPQSILLRADEVIE
jgi:putative tryptophan/tyrosine transport system substrate-binding protein